MPTMNLPVCDLPVKSDERPTAGLIFQSLKQSRQKWLSTFPKFSGKSSTVSHPPIQQIQLKGRCDIEIGPHIFPATAFYEVRYATNATSVASSIAAAASTNSSISPALLNQVNAAASSNPTLANLIQLAASGDASAEQLKTLGLLIQSLAIATGVPATGSGTEGAQGATTTMPMVLSSPPFDVLLEFFDLPSERFLLPRTVPTVMDSSPGEVKLTTRLPFPNALPYNGLVAVRPQVATFTIRRPPEMINAMLNQWIDLSQRETFQAQLDAVQDPPRAYLQYNVDEGEEKDKDVKTLLSQLAQAALHPSAALLKPIKPGPNSTTTAARKRKAVGEPAAKRPRVTAPSTQVTQPIASPAPGALAGPSTQPMGGTIFVNQSAPAVAAKVARTPKPKAIKPPKMKSSSIGFVTSAPTPAILPPLHCVTCHAVDVPLLFGGRYCRPCVERSKDELSLPPTTSNSAFTYLSPYSRSTYTAYSNNYANFTPYGGFQAQIPTGVASVVGRPVIATAPVVKKAPDTEVVSTPVVNDRPHVP